MNAFDIIYNNLKSGKVYGEYCNGKIGKYFWAVLSYDRIKKFWKWTHFGSSANKATKAELKWILSVIFEMSPEEFCEKYVCGTWAEIDKLTN